MRIAVSVPQEHLSYSDLRSMWVWSEDAGVDAVFTWDHFFPVTGDPHGRHFEAYALLAAMAEVTSRVEIGALVTCAAYRNPNLLADAARTIDHISQGRFVLGVGAGWYERDFREYGFGVLPVRTRLKTFETVLQTVKYRFERLNPPPVRRIPMLLGGSGPQVMLRLVAMHADIWHSRGGVDAFVRDSGTLDRWCERMHRDPREIERAVTVEGIDAVAQAEAFAEHGARLFVFRLRDQSDLQMVQKLGAWRDNTAP